VAQAEKLHSELRAAVFGAPEGFVVLDKGSLEAARGRFGDARTLPEGKYVLRTEFAGEAFEEPFWINTDAATAVVFNAERVLSAGLAAGGAARKGGAAGQPAGKAAKAGEAKAGKPKADKPPQPAPAARFCTGCGERLKPAARFCTACGKKVEGR